MANYPTIANCNYESSDTETGKAIHAARKLASRGAAPVSLRDALDALEETLTSELTESGEFERGVLSEQACNRAEAAVESAYLDAVEASSADLASAINPDRGATD